MFEKLKYNIARFMYGRYGVDSLYKGLLFLYLAFVILNMVFESFVFRILMSITLVYLIFRMLSKNHSARAKENQIYLKMTSPIKRFFKINTLRIKDIKTRRYRICPHCKASVRLPIKKGRHNVNCPKCSRSFTVNIKF